MFIAVGVVSKDPESSDSGIKMAHRSSRALRVEDGGRESIKSREEDEPSPALLTQTFFSRITHSSVPPGKSPDSSLATLSRRVEDQLVQFKRECLGELPKGIKLHSIVHKVVEESLALSSPLKSRWTDLLLAERSRCVIHDSFWFVLCSLFELNCFKRATSCQETIESFFKRISRNYVLLLFTVPERKKKTFATRYLLSLEAILQACFKVAYPGSKLKFDQAFANNLRELLARWFLGVGNVKSVQAATSGMLLENGPRKSSSAHATTPSRPSDGEKRAKDVDLAFHVSRKGPRTNKSNSCPVDGIGRSQRKTYSLLHSPLVASFLEQQRVGSVGSRKWRLNIVVTECEKKPIFYSHNAVSTQPRHSLNNGPTQPKSRTYLDMVQDSEGRRKDWLQTHERLSSEVRH